MEADAQRGVISGKIVESGEPVSGVRIELEETEFGAVSGKNGEFVIGEVPVGRYHLHAQMSGYKTLHAEVESPSADLIFSLEPDVFHLEGVVVSATRNEISRKEAPIIVSVIDDRLFEATQSLSLSDGLNFQPGLRMETNCQNCGFSQLRMNGLDGAYSQILIDGRPVFSALNGIYGLEQIPAAMIDRVEVIRGGGSALYGSNAIGGTVNIITKDPIENDFQLGLYNGWVGMASPDRAVNLNGAIVSKNLKTGISVFGMGGSRQEYDHNGDGFSEITRMRNQSAGFKAFHKPNKFNKITAEFHGTNEYRRGGDQLDLPPHEALVAEELKSRVAGGGLTFERYSKDLQQKFSAYASAQATEMDNYYGAGMDPNGYGRTTDFTMVGGLQYTRNFENFPAGPAVLTSGFEVKSDEMQDAKPGYNLYVNQHLKLAGLYTQHEWEIHPRFRLLSGIRMDYNNLTDRMLPNPRVNFLADLTSALQFRAGYAKGFRAPQVFTEDVHVELVAGEIQAIRLSPELDAERSDTWNASLDYSKTWGKSQLSLTAESFYTRISNAFVLEEWDDAGLFILEKRNGPAATVRGVNLEAKYSPGPSLAVQAGFTLQQSFYDEIIEWSADVAADQLTDRMLRSPNQYGNFILTWIPLQNMTVSSSAVFTGPMLAPHFAGFTDADRLEETPSFLEWNIRLAYEWDWEDKFGITFQAGMQNILNSYQADFDRGPERDASYVYGPSRPRTVFAGMKFHLE